MMAQKCHLMPNNNMILCYTFICQQSYYYTGKGD